MKKPRYWAAAWWSQCSSAGVNTGFVAGTAPDIFTNHLIKFAEQVDNGVLFDIKPLIARDGVATDIYEAGLYANWGRGVSQYALPADWDTVAMAVNLDMARRAGIDLTDLRNMNWNPRDGGSFGRVVALLTRDRAGRHAHDPAFDSRQVQVHGYQTPGAGGMFGQTEWSHFAVSNGFRFQDAPWASSLHYDSPALIDTLAWLAGLSKRGISAMPEAMGKIGADAMFVSGRVAMVPASAWMMSYFKRSARFEQVFVPLPIGPTGQRSSMLNGLAHSIWSGTRHAAESWRWLRYLGSPACQAVVAVHGVVYPAVRGLAITAAQAQRKAGADPSAFLEMAAGATFAPPIARHAAQINDLLDSAIERVLLGRESPAAALPAANAKANALLKERRP